MKKQFLILASTITTLAFISCNKEKIETQQPGNSEEIATAKKPGGGGSFTPVSNKGLLGRFEFDSNLKDTTGQLADGISTAKRVLYTTDRKGATNKAIRFNEAYGIDIFDVPLEPEMSLSVWVKHDMFPTLFLIPFVTGSQSFHFAQLENKFQGGYWNNINGQYVASGPIDNNWHHMAATRDDVSLKVYIDGILIGSSPTPAGSGPYQPTSEYVVGYGYNAGTKYWKGSLDDMRIYARTLSGTEINTLANQ